MPFIIRFLLFFYFIKKSIKKVKKRLDFFTFLIIIILLLYYNQSKKMSKEILKSLWIKKDLTDYVFNYYGSNWDPETIAELVAFDIYNDASDYAIIDTEEMQKLRKEIRQLVDFIL